MNSHVDRRGLSPAPVVTLADTAVLSRSTLPTRPPTIPTNPTIPTIPTLAHILHVY